MIKQIRKSNKCVIWTRVSTSRQEKDGGSLDNQRQLCEHYAKEHNLQVVGYYGGTHESAKEMGKLCKEMITIVKKDTSISRILCSRFDRLSRDRGDAIQLMDSLRAIGVTIVEVMSGIDTSDGITALLACYKFATATLDNEIRSDNFYNGRKHCYESGAYTGVLPIGYTRIDPKTGIRTKSLNSYCYLDEQGKKIKLAFRWKLQGYTNGQILDMLNKMGLVISKQTLNHIYNNPFYAGKIRSKMLDEGMKDGKIEKAVSYEDWLKVQKIMSDRSGKYTHKKKVEYAPLKGYVICSCCGKPLTAYNQKGYWYYKCNTIGCKFNMSANKLHNKYQDILKSFDVPKDLCKMYEDMISKMLKVCNEEHVQRARLLKKERTEIEKKINTCKTRYALGEIEADIYTAAVRGFEDKLKVIDSELEQHGEILSNYEKRLEDIFLMCSNTSSWWYNADLETKKRLQKLVFPHGIFYDREKGDYRTSDRNVVFDIIDKLSESYKQKNEGNSFENPSLVKWCAG